jgi:NAD(P)-dependent dehydrogenase (short-subunit alcohol dehydrogenase family)
MTNDPRPLAAAVALVAGGTRGGGRGIAVELGAAGATVYVTGRSSSTGRSDLDRPETIEQTADAVSAAGGRGIPVRTDHSRPDQVRALIDRIAAEHNGRLDLLVNCVWGGDPLTDWEHPLWEQDLEAGLRLVRQAVETHVITSRFALPLLVARKSGLVVEVTDGNTARYRGTFFYDLAKSAVIRLAVAQAAELKPHGVAAVAITPGFLRSEAMLENFGVSEANWRDGATADPDFATRRPRPTSGGRSPRWPPTPTSWPRPAGRSPPGACTGSTGSPTPTAANPTGPPTGPARWRRRTDRLATRSDGPGHVRDRPAAAPRLVRGRISPSPPG